MFVFLSVPESANLVKCPSSKCSISKWLLMTYVVPQNVNFTSEQEMIRVPREAVKIYDKAKPPTKMAVYLSRKQWNIKDALINNALNDHSALFPSFKSKDRQKIISGSSDLIALWWERQNVSCRTLPQIWSVTFLSFFKTNRQDTGLSLSRTDLLSVFLWVDSSVFVSPVQHALPL